MENVNVICYANLNAKNSPREVTDEMVGVYFKKYCFDHNLYPVQIVIDRCDDSVFRKKRNGWNRVEELCKEGVASVIIVPTYQMVSIAFADVFEAIKEMKSLSADMQFIRENIFTKDKDYEATFQILAMIIQQAEILKNTDYSMRKEFVAATGCQASAPSAISIQLNDELYAKAYAVSKKYGMNVEELVEELLNFATNPNKEKQFEKDLGFDDED